jgi:hypothetical protein
MHRLIYPGLMIGLILILTACGSRSQPEVAQQPAESVPAQIESADMTEAAVATEHAPVSASTEEGSEGAQDVDAERQPAADATAPNEEQSAQAEQDWTAVASLEDELYVLGNPDAPIRLIDYSDFL